MSEREVNISVRNLVEFILREGSIDSKFMSSKRAQEGTKAHQKLQKINSKEFEKYSSEVYIKQRVQYENLSIVVEGRIDGIIEEGGKKIIEEIKSTNKELSLIEEDYNLLHWAQAKCYAFMYAEEQGLSEISVMLRYFSLTTEEVKEFIKDYKKEELAEFFFGVLDKYYIWAENTLKWESIRDHSIEKTPFPFPYYRSGQRELAVASYGTIKEGKKLFVQAPTGIGKTISTIFPAVKAMGEGKVSRIFYLTAKTITRSVAEEAFQKLKEKGLDLKVLTLTAKDKICFCKGESCAPESCPYADGHFNRVNDAIFQIITKEQYFTREIIEKYAEMHRVCPFEFSLDIALWSDCIICDYNYAFDPRVYLKRFFLEASSSERYAFLVDEAHNLVDRAREMFSSELVKSDFLKMKKLMKGKAPNLYKAANSINSYFIDLRHLCEDDNTTFIVQKKPPEDIYMPIRIFMKEAEEYLTKNANTEGYEELLDLFFKCNGFINITDLYDDHYVTYVDTEDRDVKLKIFCLDPSKNLKEAMKRARGEVVFSATLTPLNYFQEILGGNEEDYRLKLPSPFPKDNIDIMVAPISTRYKDRQDTYDIITDYIYSFVTMKKGNYLVFFPSYAYMKEITQRFNERFNDINSIVQQGEMSEEERENFLKEFKEEPSETLVGFCVLGGIFSEGIDLTGDRLIGAVVIGVGLPQICLERNIMKDYFNEEKGRGYEYAYMYPGMNKVLQGVGRIIRTEKDKGAALLIDDRFLTPAYERLMPPEWQPYKLIKNREELRDNLREFWNKDHEEGFHNDVKEHYVY
ncbi:Rad3-related DNA helicase [Clostridium amylolyticum]|uniref:Rad3-related DNA helicase n=1 Tax=Clostridium amylolyticum TaxID=1121298 RepID=A0A1M6M9F6_9CLOT|nr:ATP-dependent DNA helicase [Clostridium amylolyticum]SHJ80074.1 Rad3-related DNA helicase [Clostridium amylolyticum]